MGGRVEGERILSRPHAECKAQHGPPSQAKTKSRTPNRLSHPGIPVCIFLISITTFKITIKKRQMVYKTQFRLVRHPFSLCFSHFEIHSP